MSTEKRWIGVDEQPKNFIDWLRQLLQSLNIRIREGKNYGAIMQEITDGLKEVLEDVEVLGNTKDEQIQNLLTAKTIIDAECDRMGEEVGNTNLTIRKDLRTFVKEADECCNDIAKTIEDVEAIINKNKSTAVGIEEGWVVFKMPSYEEAQAGTNEGRFAVVTPCEIDVPNGKQPFIKIDFYDTLQDFEKSDIYAKITENPENQNKLNELICDKNINEHLAYARNFTEYLKSCKSVMFKAKEEINERMKKACEELEEEETRMR